MIGIFGERKGDIGAHVSLNALATTIDGRYVVTAPAGTGGAIGVASHKVGFPAGHARSRRGTDVVVTGAIFNLSDFSDICENCTSAAQLIGALYDQDRLNRLADVNGQFAAAIYDRDSHRLVLITDRMATTAIHLWRDGDDTLFATQLYTLIGDRRIARKVNPEALAQLFTMQRTIGDITPIGGVVALPAACIATFDVRGETYTRYWSLTWDSRGFNENEAARHLAEALRRAVARQTIGRNNGLLLSGGIDSRMVLAATPAGRMSSWTTASYEDNRELALARHVAAMLGSPHHSLIIDPADTLAVNDDTVVESGGLYPASNPMSAFLPRVGEQCDVMLTGHGIDYALRGYYLPTRFARIAGTKTRLPVLKPIPKRPTGKDVLESLRQGMPRATIERIVRREYTAQWWRGQEVMMDAVLRPWLETAEPYNAWDAFILHAVNKHYAFTGMMASRAVADLAIPAFDNDVLDIALSMPPANRVSSRMVHRTIRHLAPEIASLPNANTHFPADLDPWLEIGAVILRGVLRRLGLVRRASLPSQGHSDGSWQNLDGLYRHEAGHRRRFAEIRERLDGMTFGILDADGIAACIDEHLDGRASHTKLMRQLLTHDAWVRRFGIVG